MGNSVFSIRRRRRRRGRPSSAAMSSVSEDEDELLRQCQNPQFLLFVPICGGCGKNRWYKSECCDATPERELDATSDLAALDYAWNLFVRRL